MPRTMTTRSFLVRAAVLIAGCWMTGGPVQSLHAAPRKDVGVIVKNSIHSNVPAYMELRVNGKLVASGNVAYHYALWRGSVPSGSSVHLTVRWNGIVKQRAIAVTRHGTYFDPKSTQGGGFKFESTPQ